MNLAFEAGRLAERRGWASVELVDPDSLGSVLPGPGTVVVLAPEGTFLVQHARDVAALHASGKSVAVVTSLALAEDIRAWLPGDCAVVVAGDTEPASAGDGATHTMAGVQSADRHKHLIQQILFGLAGDPDPKTREIVASSEGATADLLRKLVCDPDDGVAITAIRNGNVPVDTLQTPTGGDIPLRRWAVAENPNCPIDYAQNLIRQLAEDCRRRVAADEYGEDDEASDLLEEIAMDPRCPEDLLRTLVADGVECIMASVGKNPSTPPDLLTEIVPPIESWEVDQFIRCEHITPEVLRALASGNSNSRWWATRSQNTPSDVLRTLAEDSDTYIRAGVAENPNTPIDVLSSLADDPESPVRYGLAQNPAIPLPMLERLSRTADPYVRISAAGNPNTPTRTMRVLATDSDERVRQAVVANANVAPDLLSQLSDVLTRSTDWETQVRVAENSNTPVDVLRALSTTDSDSVRRAVAENPNTPVDVLRTLSVDADSSLQIALGLSMNPNTPVDLLHSLAGSTDALVRRWVGANSATPGGVLGALAQDPEVDVRSAVAANPQSPADVLTVLAADSSGQVRWAVAQNPVTPVQVLEAMVSPGG